MDSRTVKGYVLASVAAATYGMNPLFALPLFAGGMNAESVLLLRYLLAIPLLGVMIAARGRSFRITLRQGVRLAVLGLVMAFSSLGLFLSYNYMDAGIASSLLFVYPIMVAVIMACFYGERLSPVTIVCIALALGGIALLYKSEGNATLSLTGTILVMLSSLSYAIYIVAVNRKGLNSIPTLTLTFYVLLFGVLLFVGRIACGSELTLPPADRWWLWSCVVALAVFPTAISFLCTTAAIQYIGSTPTAILGALEPVTAVFFGVLVFGETLTLRIIIGLVMIIVAVTFVVAGPGLPARLTRIRRLFPRLGPPRRSRHK